MVWRRFYSLIDGSGVWVMLGTAGLGALLLLGSVIWGSARAREEQVAIPTVAVTVRALAVTARGQKRTTSITVTATMTNAEPQPMGPLIIGYSTGGLPIESYTFGDGPRRVALIGGIHGGSEWNTILLAYTAIDYFTKHPEIIPPALTVHIVPTANPDGQKLVTGSWGRFQASDVRSVAGGRFNQNGVDLNRNWGCEWAAKAWWGPVRTSGGTAPFSEQETRVLRDFFVADWQERGAVQGVIFWHSAVPGVFAGGCTGKYAAAEELAAAYAGAAAYPYGKSFTQYPITGDATNWLASQRIPAIIVELATHTSMEWPQNRAGILAVLAQLAMPQTKSVAADEPSAKPHRSFSP